MSRRLRESARRGALAALVALCHALHAVPAAAQESNKAPPEGVPRFPLVGPGPELEGPARPGVFLADIGRRAAVLGDEGGAFEVWTWPLKLVRDLRLDFRIPEYDEPIAGARVAQRVITRPEGATIVYSNAAFTVREHVFVPLDEPGAIILLDVQTVRPLDVVVRMHADYDLAWPGSFGGGYISWDEGRHAFHLGQGGLGRYNGYVGSPFATGGTEHPAHDAPMVPSQFVLRFDPKQATTQLIPIVVAGGAMRGDSVWAIYNRLLAKAPEYWRQRAAHAGVLRDSLLALHSPDRRLDAALDWARVNLDQALACNPDLGCGLVAGFGPAGPGNFRPGFAWFFGGDAAINSFAMSSLGQFDLVRDGMSFAGKYQRADGKIAHEISQAAGRLPWFDEYPYTWYHGDTTPFWILADYEYWLASGDAGYLRELWPRIVKAFRWSAATDADGDGLMDNPKAGAGAIEVGGLGDDLHTDIYLAGVWVAALNGLRDMARATGDTAVERDASALFEKARASLERRFWMPSAGRYAFALLEPPGRPAPGAKPEPAGGYATVEGGFRLNDALTIWPTTAMSFGLLQPARADRMLAEISGAELTTDWGTRTLAKDHRLYDPLHYNNGTVWPFVTGFVALAHYRYHRAWAGWELVRDIARTTFDFSRGHNPELMSGAFYRPLDTAVPDQYFATSMLVTPLVRGLLGLEADAPRHAVTVAPHLPPEWDSVAVSGFPVGTDRLDLAVVRRPGVYTLSLTRAGPAGASLLVHASPALPLGATVRRVSVDGREVPVRVENTPHDVHALADVPLTGSAQVVVDYAGGFEVIAPSPRVQPGDAPTGLRVLDFRRDGAEYVLEVEGLAGATYELGLRGETAPRDLRGAELLSTRAGRISLQVQLPVGAGWTRREVRFRD